MPSGRGSPRPPWSLLCEGGLLGGSHGSAKLGPAGGALYGARLETILSGPSDGFFELMLGRPQRYVVDPTAAAAVRESGPVTEGLVMANVGLTILLTGGKTWHGLSPYLGGSMGLGFARTPAADSVSGFRFNAKFITGPHVGFRLYVAPTLSFRAEGRLLFWQLKYPSVYFSPPAGAPLDPPVLDPNSYSSSEWTTHPVLTLGLGLAFRL